LGLKGFVVVVVVVVGKNSQLMPITERAQ